LSNLDHLHYANGVKDQVKRNIFISFRFHNSRAFHYFQQIKKHKGDAICLAVNEIRL
jgi:vancomycin permeability regulator SanA